MPKGRLSPEAVVSAAAELADAEGLVDFTLTRLAEELDVQPSALYNHIDSADSLVSDVSVQATSELLDAVTKAAVGRSEREAIREMAIAYREYAEQHGGRYAATLVPTLADDDSRSELDRAITAAFGRVVESFGVDPEDAYDDARSIRAAIHGFVSLEATDNFPEPTRIDRSFERLITILTAGIGQT